MKKLLYVVLTILILLPYAGMGGLYFWYKQSLDDIENASFTPTVCAERTAFFKAISDGRRDFTAIAVCGGKGGVLTGAFPPCGVCRQVMREFCEDDFTVYLVNPDGYETLTLAELLPHSFSAKEHMC